MQQEIGHTALRIFLSMMRQAKAITYTVSEAKVTGYNTQITGSIESGFTIKNTHTPETIDIEGTKTWDDNDNQDGKRKRCYHSQTLC